MAGTVPLPTPKPHAAAPPSSSAAATETVPLSAEEEAFKRNTDCVYFLASPLTCKKGSDCEYRHSDTARVNPRDCWYWLHGNCLNPKCAFRHPPLDGLLGTPVPNPAGVSGPISQPGATPIAPVPAPYTSGKQGVPCIFFQKGNCLKGDWCPFSHGPNSANSKVMQGQAAAPGSEPAMLKKTFGLEKCTQEKKAPQSSMLKPVDLFNQKKLSNKALSTATQEFTGDKYSHRLSAGGEEFHGYNPVDTRGPNDGRITLPGRVQPTLQVNSHATTLNGKDAEEVSREPSPGFDVLVDNELGDSDYYHGEDRFASARGHEGMVEYFDGRSGDCNSRVDPDRDLYHDSRAYDSYDRPRGQYARESRRSSEHISGGQTHQDRRRCGRADSPDLVEHNNLRNRLSKPRRENGLRSVINHDYTRERPDGRRLQGYQRDLSHDCERQETSLSSRLRGRIKVPGTSSTLIDGNDRHGDRELGRGGRDQRRTSPGRPQVSSRLRDRIKGLGPDGMNNDSRNNLPQRMGRDIVSDNEGSFAAPKRLAELRGRKYADGSDEQLTGKRKFVKYDSQLQSGDDLSFEGPKPLEEILKRKKRAETADFEDNQTSHTTQSNHQSRREESKGVEGYGFASSKSGSSLSHDKNEDYKPLGVNSVSDDKFLPDNTNDGGEFEEGMIVEGGAEDQEPEAYNPGDEEVDYEHGDGDSYNLDDGENGDAEEEYLDEDDDDDDDEFAKKLGVMY